MTEEMLQLIWDCPTDLSCGPCRRRIGLLAEQAIILEQLLTMDAATQALRVRKLTEEMYFKNDITK